MVVAYVFGWNQQRAIPRLVMLYMQGPSLRRGISPVGGAKRGRSLFDGFAPALGDRAWNRAQLSATADVERPTETIMNCARQLPDL